MSEIGKDHSTQRGAMLAQAGGCLPGYVSKPVHLATNAGELYPTQVRTTAHGLSAGTAKVGALWAAVWFFAASDDTSTSIVPYH